MPLRRSALALSIGAVTFSLLAFVIYDSWRLVGEPFPGFLTWDNGTLVAFHGPEWTGVRSGIPQRAGRVVGVNGAPFRDGRTLLEQARKAPLGTPITYSILADGRERQVTVPTMRLTVRSYLETFGVYLGGAVIFFLIALVVIYLQPQRSDARALTLLLVLAGAILALAVDTLCSYRLVRACLLVEAATPVAVLQLGLVFPSERLRLPVRRFVVAILFAFALAIGWANGDFIYAAPDASRSLTYAVYLTIAASLVALAGSLAYAIFRANRPVDRIRAAVVFSGAVVSCLLPASAILAFFLLDWSFSFTWISGLLVFFPLSIAFAVVRYDLLESERFIRLTLGYTAASAASVVVYSLVLVVVDSIFGVTAPANPATAFLFIVVLVFLFDPVRSRVQRGIDRVFFRTGVDVGRALEESGVELASQRGEPEIVAYLERKLADVLGLDWVRVCVNRAAPEDAQIQEGIWFGEEELGRIACGSKKSGAPFSSTERELVRAVAAQAALALRYARALDELRAAQSALVQAERLAAVGELAGSVAHGIRNPLAGIRASAQVAREQARTPELHETLDDVIRESDRLEQRVRTLLDFSRPFDPRRRAIDLADLLAQIEMSISRRARGQNVEIDARSEPTPFPIETDPDFLEEALLELAGNALNAMPDGGRLELLATVEAGQPVLTISDSGPGIPASQRTRIFELFFTARPEGTGVGLATVKKIVGRLGGSIACDDSTENGARFRIELP